MTDQKRRQLITALGAGAVAVPLTAVVGSLPSHAADTAMVDPESAQATALKYSAVSEKADQSCAGCTLFQGEADAKAGGCPLFPGSHVASEAWCTAYTPKG